MQEEEKIYTINLQYNVMHTDEVPSGHGIIKPSQKYSE